MLTNPGTSPDASSDHSTAGGALAPEPARKGLGISALWCGFLLLFIVVVIRTAWVGDDAYIGFRLMDNFVNGEGLRWNLNERVQVFTHPLWMFVLSAFYVVTREPFLTTMGVSIIASTAAVLIMSLWVSASRLAAAAALAVLVSSKAFIDFTTSGLENPLSYLLAALFCTVLFRSAPGLKQLRLLILFTALSTFNRLDTLLLFAPATAFVAWSLRRTSAASWGLLVREALVYSAPLWGWILFATIYFGFALPNTYYAKMHTGIAKIELVAQGLLYYVNSLNLDPVTLIAIALSVALAVIVRDPKSIACAVGVVLYLLYVVSIGGDFMTGRFFTVPLFFAICWLTRCPLSDRTWLALAVLFLALGLIGRRPPLLSDDLFAREMVWDIGENPAPNSTVDHRGIADERAAYFQGSGLGTVLRHNRRKPSFEWARMGLEARKKGRHISIFRTPGFFGFYAGPKVHIIDTYALGDPLLAKLPVLDRNNWRVGHYQRGMPYGYLESIQTGENLIDDPQIHELYRVIKILTQDPIWSSGRLKEVVKMNFGFYNDLLRSIDPSAIPPAPETGTSYRWPDPAQRTGPAPLLAKVTAGWGAETDAGGRFWWCSKDAHISFVVSAGRESAPVLIPIQRVNDTVQLEFTVNGANVRAETLPPTADSRFVIHRLPGTGKLGRNVIAILGSGQPTHPGPHDPRPLLFALQDPRWEQPR